MPGRSVGERERVLGAGFGEHLAARFLEGVDLGERGPDDDGGTDAAAEHVDPFAERAAEDEAQDRVAVERILHETGGAVGAEPAWLQGDVGLGVEVADFFTAASAYFSGEEGRHRAFLGEPEQRGRGPGEVRVAGLQARVDAAVDGDGVGALAHGARACTVTR
jgi:hypothetical protein